MRHLYDLLKNTNSHGIASLPFLRLIQFYLEESDQTLTKNAISELYYNLSSMTLSGARDLRFDASSHFTARLSFLLKHATFGNQTMREIENEVAAQKIKQKTVFEPKIGDPLDDVIKIIDLPMQNIKKQCFRTSNRLLKLPTKLTQNKKLLTLTLSTYKTNSTK